MITRNAKMKISLNTTISIREEVTMDWLIGMNNVMDYVEENITEGINYDTLAKMLCCSSYEFGRIFSFMAGVSISEYIRRRRLSLAAFDVQDKNQKIIDIAMKYGYESPASFTRAFREMHGTSPLLARKQEIPLKTYPKLSFKFTIQGVEEMNFRIVKKDDFKIMGLKGMSTSIAAEGENLDPLWTNFMNNYNDRLWNGVERVTIIMLLYGKLVLTGTRAKMVRLHV